MNVRDPMNACGAKTSSGEPCKRAPRPNGRCNLHGGKSPGGPIKHGRRSKYVSIFGQNFAALLRDPDLLKCDAEIALFDTFLAERADLLKEGVSREWVDDLRKVTAELRHALYVEPNANRVSQKFRELEAGLDAADKRLQAWAEILGAARSRAEVAVKADTLLQKREQSVTDSTVAALLIRVLDIFKDVAGDELARRAAARVDYEVFRRVGPGVQPQLPAGGEQPAIH